MDARMLLAIAEAVVDDAERIFLAGMGTAERVDKSGGDFATTSDLSIEALLRRELTAITGIPVYGEEGGGSLEDEAVWVVDPIDGTANYVAGNPMCAILVSLLYRGAPVVALCSIPALDKRLTAFAGSPLLLNGKPQPPIAHPHRREVQIGYGSIVADRRHDMSSALRHELLAKLADEDTRLRVTGSVGVDLAFVALGIFTAAVTFSPFVWDNAAGVLLVQAAGGVATGLDGHPWRIGATGVIAGVAAKHNEILSTIDEIRKEEKV
ncbi:inositol monophosphatase family protein [Corynebacterium sp. H127]|uniref:inositol monophosphatase family protein n=1 Tax=Corynebacterium sp. H127 TaxID=3133418 RepID=UPI0030A30E7A